MYLNWRLIAIVEFVLFLILLIVFIYSFYNAGLQKGYTRGFQEGRRERRRIHKSRQRRVETKETAKVISPLPARPVYINRRNDWR